MGALPVLKDSPLESPGHRGSKFSSEKSFGWKEGEESPLISKLGIEKDSQPIRDSC